MRPSPDFEGLGFSLVATKNQVGQFVDDVKPNSPAEKSGLKSADMVFEVNGENILSYSHQKVVELMRRNPQELCLLVLDPDSRAYYDNASVVVHGQMAEVERICSWSDENSTARLQTDLPETSVTTAAVINANGDSPASGSQSPPSRSEPAKHSGPHSRRSRGTTDGTSFGQRAKVFDDL
nr:unnamed protein product [Spirometra erinaceieuropaei]